MTTAAQKRAAPGVEHDVARLGAQRHLRALAAARARDERDRAVVLVGDADDVVHGVVPHPVGTVARRDPRDLGQSERCRR